MRYPAAFLDQLRQIASVSATIGARIPIKRHGREFHALCPFHKEKSPSFTINDEKGFFHCFGCGAHGDAIGFIKDYEGISYKEAIEKLAGEVGLALPKPSAEAVREEQKRRSLQEVCELACRWFEAQLASSDGFEARRYLEQRGLNNDILQRFRIGFAPDDRGALAQALAAQGVSTREMIAAGLLIQPDDSSREPYSRFRGRVMFPIRDGHSKVVAFGGRILQARDNAPKYLNSPETELFHKGHILYNADLAQRAVRGAPHLLVCEGYMDVIALAQAGIDAAVAPLGTAITEHQLRRMWQWVDEPVLCLDGDAAGQRAMNRAGDLALPLLQPSKSLRFIQLPAGEDPDTLVRSEGKTAFMKRCEMATPLVQHLCQQVLGKPASTPEERAGQEKALLAQVERIEDAIVQAHYRDYVRQQFWARRSPAGQKHHTAKSQQAGNAAAATVIPFLPSSGDVHSRKARAIVRGFALLVSFPQLCTQRDAEWFTGELAMPDSALQQLQETACGQLMQAGSLQADALLAAASSRLKPKLEAELQVLARLRSDDIRLPARLWQQMLAAHREACLMEDYAQAEREMAQQLSPERWDRFAALKAELEALSAQQQAWQSEQLFEESSG